MPDPEPGTLRVHLDTRVGQRLFRQRADITGGVRAAVGAGLGGISRPKGAGKSAISRANPLIDPAFP